MTARAEEGASASPNVLPFPKRNKGRIRKTRCIEAGGEFILNHMALCGEAEPANVARIRPMPEPSPVERSPAMLLAVTVWTSVPADRQANLLGQIRYIASAEHCPHALALLGLLGDGR